MAEFTEQVLFLFLSIRSIECLIEIKIIRSSAHSRSSPLSPRALPVFWVPRRERASLCATTRTLVWASRPLPLPSTALMLTRNAPSLATSVFEDVCSRVSSRFKTHLYFIVWMFEEKHKRVLQNRKKSTTFIRFLFRPPRWSELWSFAETTCTTSRSTTDLRSVTATSPCTAPLPSALTRETKWSSANAGVLREIARKCFVACWLHVVLLFVAWKKGVAVHVCCFLDLSPRPCASTCWRLTVWRLLEESNLESFNLVWTNKQINAVDLLRCPLFWSFLYCSCFVWVAKRKRYSREHIFVLGFLELGRRKKKEGDWRQGSFRNDRTEYQAIDSKSCRNTNTSKYRMSNSTPHIEKKNNN